ncbi:hypothetical protein Taro_045631 [Colocasia esculenta]|uniref:Uncharacterized protein n=1 Tax=Colocasia esculenta TaxID=4460 RepID=A0A843X539_COLES|nr:hypothetical protein [Colocasia esculenta]
MPAEGDSHIWTTSIIFDIILFILYTYVTLQALQSNRRLGSTNFLIPAASITVFNQLALTLWIPIYDRILVPWLRRLTGKEGGITMLQRIGVGFALSVLAVLVAAIVEQWRKRSALGHPSAGSVAENGGAISSMSCLWLIPQLSVYGVAEAFAVIGQMEFYYKELPENMRSVAGSFFFCGFAVGGYVSGFLVTVVNRTTGRGGEGNSWLAEDLNQGELDHFYSLIAGLGLLNFIYFLVCARWYKYKKSYVAQEELRERERGMEEEENGGSNIINEEIVKYRGWKAMPYVIGNETFEKLGTLGISSNLLVYLTSVFNMSSVDATTLLNIWFGTANIATLFGAFLSDAYFGRYVVISFASIASFLGMVIITLTAAIPGQHPRPCSGGGGTCQEPSTSQMAFLLSGLGLMVVGSGGIRPCNLAFGADQFDPGTEAGKKGINSFFNWYYFTFTTAMMVSSTAIIYLQSNVSWVLGFAIPAGLMFLSCIIFFLGTPIYVRVRPEGSPLTGVAQVAVAAFRKRRLRLPEGGPATAAALFNPASPTNGVNTRLPHTDQFRFLDKAAIATSKDEIEPNGLAGDPWRLCTLQQVEEVKCLLRVIPVWSTGILYYACESQQNNYPVLTALQSDRHLGKHFAIPAASFTVFIMLAVSLWLPVYDRVVVPWLRGLTGKEKGITLLQKMGVGIVLSVVATVISAMVEERRRRIAQVYPTIGKTKHGSDVSSMSGLWLIIQLTVAGVSEAFNITGQIEFYYKQFPENMRSIAGAFLFCGFAIGNYVSGFLVTVVHRTTKSGAGGGEHNWLAEDLNKGKLDNFYYLIAALGMINFFYFLACASWYKYKIISVVVDEAELEMK